MSSFFAAVVLGLLLMVDEGYAVTFSVTLDLPPDQGQPLGTLLELTDHVGAVVAHVGAPYHSGTYIGNNHRELAFHVNLGHSAKGTWTNLGAPFPEVHTETRLTVLNGTLYAFNRDIGGHNVATLHPDDGGWTRQAAPPTLSTWGGALEVCGGTLVFEERAVQFVDSSGSKKNILDLSGLETSGLGTYAAMMAHYADGDLFVCAMGEVKNLYLLASWACGDAKAKVHSTHDDPTTGSVPPPRNFPYAMLKPSTTAPGFLVGTNLGDVYLVTAGGLEIVNQWARPYPITRGSYQPYTYLRVGARVLQGQYPTGGVFEYNVTTHNLTFPVPNVDPEPGAGRNHREAQQLLVYGDELLLGVWPWGTVHGRSARDATGEWSPVARLFSTPAVTTDDAAWVSYIRNETGNYSNAWGQRVEGGCIANGAAYLSTSAKNFGAVQLARDLIPGPAREEYGAVWRLDAPGQASGHFRWPRATLHQQGSREISKSGGLRTVLTLTVEASGMQLRQDGRVLGSSAFPPGATLPVLSGAKATTCRGIFGPCPPGVTVTVSGL